MPRSDARIILAGNTANPLTGFVEGRNMRTRNRLLDAQTERFNQDREQKDVVFEQGNQDRERAEAERVKAERAARFVKNRAGLAPLLEAGDIPAVARNLVQFRNETAEMGLPTDETDHLLSLIGNNQIDRVKNVVASDLAEAQQAGLFSGAASGAVPPAGTREFEALLKAAESDDPTTKKAAMVQLGLTPRAGTVGSDERVSQDQALSELIAEHKARQAAAVEGAKNEVSREQLQQDNARTFDVWQVARSGLISGLEGTSTGPIKGVLPALTANQQIADGAISAIAPVLKQIFRAAGEGTFTDRDQEMLLNMAPTRKDLPEARLAKMQLIDGIIAAKLGIVSDGGGGITGTGTADDPIVIPD